MHKRSNEEDKDLIFARHSGAGRNPGIITKHLNGSKDQTLDSGQEHAGMTIEFIPDSSALLRE